MWTAFSGRRKKIRDIHVVNGNSTYYGGGVAELLSSLTLILNSAGIKTGWRVIEGSPERERNCPY